MDPEKDYWKKSGVVMTPPSLKELQKVVVEGWKAFHSDEVQECPYTDTPRRNCWIGGFFCAFYQTKEEIDA